jgi:hypothetical protein
MTALRLLHDASGLKFNNFLNLNVYALSTVPVVTSVFRLLVGYWSALRYVLYSASRVTVIVNSEEINDMSNNDKEGVVHSI